ncbi:MAG: hypothetical protein M3540_00760, partial [Actinomycetota bacterium]|nr:hypothetical protein [Actinomycetota bacterium]
MMVINPVAALAEVGVELSPAVGTHVLHALQHPPELRKRRQELVKRLRKALDGERPNPRDPRWLSETLFDKLGLEPLSTRSRKPVFKPALNQERLDRLERRRPELRRAELPRVEGGLVLTVAPWRGAFRRLDLEAPVPEVPHARTKPSRVSLSDLWFYKDSSPVARDLLE